MKVSSATLSVAVAFFASSEATTNSSTAVCNSFVTCASCACSTYSYSLQDECNNGCAWLPDTQSYVTAEEAQASGDTAFYSLFVGNPTLPEESLRDEWLRAGRTTCEVGTVTGPITSVWIMLGDYGLLRMVCELPSWVVQSRARQPGQTNAPPLTTSHAREHATVRNAHSSRVA